MEVTSENLETAYFGLRFSSSPVLSSHAFFENAGGSFPCRQVVDRLHRFYTDRKVQPYAPYPGAEAGGAEMDEARTRLAEMMGVAREEVSFGPSTSANTYVLAQAVRQWLRSPMGIRRRNRWQSPRTRFSLVLESRFVLESPQ